MTLEFHQRHRDSTPRGQTTATPNEINETSTITFKKTGDSWQAVLIHVAVTGRAITPH
jgi:hypothetical protein